MSYRAINIISDEQVGAELEAVEKRLDEIACGIGIFQFEAYEADMALIARLKMVLEDREYRRGRGIRLEKLDRDWAPNGGEGGEPTNCDPLRVLEDAKPCNCHVCTDPAPAVDLAEAKPEPRWELWTVQGKTFRRDADSGEWEDREALEEAVGRVEQVRNGVRVLLPAGAVG